MTKPVAKTIEMTKKQFNAWIKHLTSGKIKQTQNGCLIDSDGAMCCLGVLEYACEGKVEALGFPSDAFLKRNNIKFKDEIGDYTKDDDHNGNSPYLTGGYANELNDDEGLSFKQIAQRLKARVKFIPEKKK